MGNITIKINTDNNAFKESVGLELGHILKVLAYRLENGLEPGKIADSNGNTVGTVTYEGV